MSQVPKIFSRWNITWERVSRVCIGSVRTSTPAFIRVAPLYSDQPGYTVGGLGFRLTKDT
jgi:hypothetical protein